MYNINYIIATYSGKSSKREEYDTETNLVLQKHMKTLSNKLKDSKYITQVTIIKPMVTGNKYQDYYKIDEYILEIQKLGIKVILLETNITFGSSYSQYIYAYKTYPDFDFYIIMEDDWIPYKKNFDEKLLECYKEHDYKGFHSAWTNKFSFYPVHSAISVGIIDKYSFQKILNDNSNLENNYRINQIRFSKLFSNSNLPLTDYSNKGKNYMIPFWETGDGVIYEYALYLSSRYLLVPIQFLQPTKYTYVIGNWKLHSQRKPSDEVIQWIKNKEYLNKINMT